MSYTFSSDGTVKIRSDGIQWRYLQFQVARQHHTSERANRPVVQSRSRWPAAVMTGVALAVTGVWLSPCGHHRQPSADDPFPDGR